MRHPAIAGDGLWHALRVRHVPPERSNNGDQVEEPDHWLRNGNPWEIERPELTQRIRFGGRTEISMKAMAASSASSGWTPTTCWRCLTTSPCPATRTTQSTPCACGSAAATDEFDLGEFNAGDYAESVAAKNTAENITMVLYPNDASENGKELRLRQQYFLASASLQDVH